MTARDDFQSAEDFHRFIHEQHMHGLWEISASQNTPWPTPEAVPYLWPWSLMEQVVRQSCITVPVGNDRRAMQLYNPGLNGRWATTNTLIAAVQVLMPTEVAPAHRHSPAAIRFIMEGKGAYTAVEGERLYMHRGDLVLTPKWQWHEHGNDGDETVVWMDGLDVPLVKMLDAFFFERYPDRQAPATRPAGTSVARHGHGGVTPTWLKRETSVSPLMVYSYERARQALHALRNEAGDPYEGIALEYVNPHTGGAALPTIGCRLQLLRPGERLKAHRVTGSAVYCVVEGEGRTVIDGRACDWRRNDILALPSWAMHEHANTGSGEAVLFSINDRPVLEKLDLFRQDVLAGNGGYQELVA
jgi:gentisate 1,2-dioxygenase